MKPTRCLRNARIVLVILGLLLCIARVPAADSGPEERPVLRVPPANSKPMVDGRLDDPCWKDAAMTGPLKATKAQPGNLTTEAFILRDADHLYVGVSSARKEPVKEVESVELLIDSNGDRNSYYLIRIANEGGGKISCSYNEFDPPWHDRTWQPQFRAVAATGANGWTAEFALPLTIFNKNKTLASKIGFNIRRFGMPGGETHCWHGAFAKPGDGGMLTDVPALDSLPQPDYVKLDWLYRATTKAKRAFLAEEEGRTVQLGPGSAHPGTTGEVELELEGFLLAGHPHARGIIWDLAVDQQNGELYVLSDPRPVREAPELRVFDRQGKHLRTIMPFNPTLPRSSVRDLCGKMAREGETDLVIPKMFETLCGSLSMYGAWWNLPQKIAIAPNGDLILSNIYRGTIWRMKTDGSLPPEGWTSAHHDGRNEPFESTVLTQNFWKVQGLKNYMPFQILRYPYFCFDTNGLLYVSDGHTSRPTRQYGYHWEVGEEGGSYHWEASGDEGRGAYVWKCKLHSSVKMEKPNSFGGFAEPSGLAIDGGNLIVADAGNDRLQVIRQDGRPIASITHYEHEGKKEPLYGPTALAIDNEKNLYVLIASEKRPADPRVERTLASLRQAVVAEARKPLEAPWRLIKLKSWQDAKALAISDPLDPDVLQIAVDAGVSPPLVWVANGVGPGSLLKLAGDDLSVKAKWVDNGETLSYPRQSGNQPLLNIDPQTGHLYVEDDSNYRIKRYGTVYRVDQDGKVLKKWPPLFFDARDLKMTSPWGALNYQRHFRYPDEPLFIDSIFGKDGRIYRWKLGTTGVEILRFDRAGKPIPFEATGTHALFVDHTMQVNFWHDVYHGMDVDRHGNIYYVAKVDVDAKSRPISAYNALRRQVNVYDADGNLKNKGLLVLECVRGIQVDDEGYLYALHRPAERPWEDYLALSRFAPSGGEPLWTRPWDGYIGQAEAIFAPCHCITSRQHQTLDGKGYLYADSKYSVQVIDCDTGKLVGEFGSYGNMDCKGKSSAYPHPELPFGTISALSVWKDRLFVVDMLNRRIVKCRIVYGQTEKRGT